MHQYTSAYLRKWLVNYPELQALVGVPQPERWHPEGDAFEHTMMVLDQANQRYPEDRIINLAAVCHDLGKALTPKDTWPKHYGHETLGLQPTMQFLSRLNLTQDTIDCVMFLVKYHMHMHKVRVMNYKTYLKIYLESDKLLKGAPMWALLKLAKLGVCDHYGRGGVDPNERYIEPIEFVSIMTELDKAKVENLAHKEQLRFVEDTLRRFRNVE